MIAIKEEFISRIVEHSKKEYPYEACGILGGKKNKVAKVYEMSNIAKNPETYYFMEPQEQLKVFKDMRNSGIELIGAYHSHPASPAYPSERDCKMAFYPEAFYLIVSLKVFGDPKINAYRIVDSKIEDVQLKIKS